MEKPKHIAIILDGNRRFARKQNIKPWKGHTSGVKNVENLFRWCKDFDIKELTLYIFSMQNFKRPKEEFDHLMNLFIRSFEKAKNSDVVNKNKINVSFIGRLDQLPENVQKKIKEVEEKTKDYSDYKVNFAIAYGGREEIIDAVKKIGKDIKEEKISLEEIDEDVFSKYLYLDSEPDIVIRTGGNSRISNFLLWQSIYSEWFFLDKTWPEFTKEDFRRCIEDYSDIKRNFGK